MMVASFVNDHMRLSSGQYGGGWHSEKSGIRGKVDALCLYFFIMLFIAGDCRAANKESPFQGSLFG